MHKFSQVLNRQQFWASIRLWYGLPIPVLLVSCLCREGFNIQVTMSCKKGGFATLWHNKKRDKTAALLSDVCKDVKLEPSSHLTLNGEEQMMRKTTKANDEVLLGICGSSFWVSDQRVFFDVKVFNPNVWRYSKQTLKQCYFLNENERKHHFNTRILEMDQVSFMPLAFTVAGGIGGEVRSFYSWLAMLLLMKNGIRKS